MISLDGTQEKWELFALSPLFNFALEYAIRKVQETNLALDINGTHQVLAYADDVNLIGDMLTPTPMRWSSIWYTDFYCFKFPIHKHLLQCNYQTSPIFYLLFYQYNLKNGLHKW